MLTDLPIGIGTTFDYSIPFEPMCRMVAQAGFKAITIGGGNVAHSGYDVVDNRQRIGRIVAEHGLVVDSVHAPFGPECDIAAPDISVPAAIRIPLRNDGKPEGELGVCEPASAETPAQVESQPADSKPQSASQSQRVAHKSSPDRLAAVARVRTAIDAAMSLDSQVVIIHPTVEFPIEETRARIQALRDSLSELIPYAANRNVRLAIENLPSLLSMQVFEAALDEYSELGVCYDSSHAQLSTNPFGVLRRFRDRIITLHISDNLGQKDDHLLPFEGVIDWDEFALYARQLKHLQTFMLEVEVRESAFRDTREFLNQAFQRTQRLLAL
jgi:sugar phosphate isomerase/epimerase